MEVIRIGSRRSQLALSQTNTVVSLLRSHFPELRFEVVGIVTEGDRLSDGNRRGKDVFVKAIEEKLIAGEIDLAVHSLKDMPVKIPEQLTIASVPKREDPRDALISIRGERLNELPYGARVGTSSLRRKAQLLKTRPDLEVVEIRGNVGTRIEKMHKMGLDAIILAYSGLIRLGIQDKATEVLETDVILPAAGQGALAVEARKDDSTIIKLAKTIEDRDTRIAVDSERLFLEKVGGGCNLPVAVYSHVLNGRIVIEGMISDDEYGRLMVRGREESYVSEYKIVVERLAEKLLKRRQETMGEMYNVRWG